VVKVYFWEAFEVAGFILRQPFAACAATSSSPATAAAATTTVFSRSKLMSHIAPVVMG